jgi:DHA1 family multidrug resistance protein-like MFS transporter
MDRLERILSRPVAKPYRSHGIDPNERPYLNANGFVDFGPGDIENPKNWSTARHWYITVVAVLLVVNATFASSSPSGSLVGIAHHFRVSEEAAGLVITLFLLGYCAGPLIFAPLSEFYGRRWVFYITFTSYLAFNFLCAFANNFGALLVGRFLTGTFASAPLSNSPGVLADIWDPIERGNAMAVFAMMTFVGPALGPVVSGFLELKKDWRWNFYVLLWLAGATEVLMFTIPETLPSVVLTNKARRIRAAKVPGFEDVKAPAEAEDRKLTAIFKVALIRPWKILVDPISFLVAVYLSVVYTLLYMLFTIYPIVFQQKRGWNSGVGELPLIGTAVGAVIGGGIIFAVSARDKKRLLECGVQQRALDRSHNGWHLPGYVDPVGFRRLSKLPHRHLLDVHGECDGRKHDLQISLWRSSSSLHAIHVQCSWRGRRRLTDWRCRRFACAYSLHLLPIRRTNSQTVQICPDSR